MLSGGTGGDGEMEGKEVEMGRSWKWSRRSWRKKREGLEGERQIL